MQLWSNTKSYIWLVGFVALVCWANWVDTGSWNPLPDILDALQP